MRVSKVALTAAALALMGGGMMAAPAAADAGGRLADGPCRAEPVIGGVLVGARSVCPPGTYRHWHQVHVTCRKRLATYPAHGPITGGTGVSEVRCTLGWTVSNWWNTQGPDD
ncbi:hypothetical protein GCM10009544_16950 [Streptomyces stramineus]|uniref:Secreted protein n=1 Tax=Streptomyces stramineus TaxID=173861 RepID=A0ABN0ZPU3_9ACTN